MGSRALGALFALVAALAFAASIATSAWWSGPPIVDGHVREVQQVDVGLLGAKGCNPGGEGGCETIEVSDTLRLTSYGVLGAHALATLLALLLAISAARVGDGRKGLATASMLVTLLAAGGAGAMLALGPAIQAGSSTVEVPFGYGLYILGGAVVSSLLASLLARRIEPEPLRLKPGIAPAMPAPPPDIRDVLRADHEGVRPSAPHMFEGAPQLRPLYDAEGVPPAPTTPSVPMRAPTPLPRAAIDVLTGNATPPPLQSPMPRAKPPSLAPPPSPTPDAFAQTMPVPPSPPRSKPGTTPPRTKPPSAAPPASRPAPKVDLAGPTLTSPPKPPRAKTLPSGTDPGDKRAQSPQSQRGSQPQVQIRPSAPTLAHSVPPMPTADNIPAPPVLPAQRAHPDDDEGQDTGVEIDHEAKAKAQHAKLTKRPGAPAVKPVVPPPAKGAKPVPPQRHDTEVGEVGDVTDVGLEARAPSRGNIITDENRILSTEQRAVARAPTDDPFDHQREITVPPRQFTDPVHAPISETFPVQRISELVPASIVPDEGADNTAQTQAAPEAPEPPEDLMSTMQRDKTPIPTLNARSESRMASETPPSGTSAGSKPPVSTAPSSLPPPKNLNVDTVPSGPTPACPQCESPMAWVEEHLRFYCKSCRMYF